MSDGLTESSGGSVNSFSDFFVIIIEHLKDVREQLGLSDFLGNERTHDSNDISCSCSHIVDGILCQILKVWDDDDEFLWRNNSDKFSQ